MPLTPPMVIPVGLTTSPPPRETWILWLPSAC